MLENITAKVEYGEHNPEWPDSTPWKVTLKNGRGYTYTVPFYTGSAVKGEPTALEVLWCLARDASSYRDARNFEDWAEEFGYSPDSRAAEKTFKACKRISKRLETFLTAEEFGAVLELDL